jgi:hypothetical protein|tara:strand:- start:4082 stop:4303 length:222 start_codon:yes stop_codon:yes gene_type:complete
MDPSVDFMPTQNEFRIIYEKIKKSTNNSQPNTRYIYSSNDEKYGHVYHQFEKKDIKTKTFTIPNRLITSEATI